MRLATLLVAGVSAASAQQGWSNLGPNTIFHLPGTHDVCPPNNYNGISFNFNDQCPYVYDAWGGAAADTKRNRLLIFGGGHVATIDNSIYGLDLTPSPVIQYLTRPGSVATTQFVETTDTPPQPVSSHSYDCLVYLPNGDKLFWYMTGGDNYTGTSGGAGAWLADASQTSIPWVNPWARVADNPFAGGSSVTGASCGIDPTTAHESVLVLEPVSWTLNRYDTVTNAWTNLSNAVTGALGTAVVDPVRLQWFLFGNDGAGGSGTNRIWRIDLAPGSTYAPTDIYPSTTGCAGLVSVTWPGAAYDLSIHRIAGYPNTGNTVYIFDPGTLNCVAQTFTGGPTGSANNNSNGIFGRFAYFPKLGKYIVANNPAAPAYTFTLPASGTFVNGNVTATGKRQ